MSGAGKRSRGRATRGWPRLALALTLGWPEMEYVNLGNTGLRVSRVCLGMMSYGTHESRAVGARRGRRRADRAPRGRGRDHVLRHRRRLQRRRERGGDRPAPAEALRHARGVRRRDEGARADDARRERRAASRASTSSPRSTRRCSGSGSTTSTSTRSTAGTRRRRSRRRWRRCTTSSGPARRATSARAACSRGSSRRRSASRQTRFVSMQNHYNLIYREEEREMIPQCIDQGVARHPVEPARARPARRQPRPAGASG